jgi:hypothetical protein
MTERRPSLKVRFDDSETYRLLQLMAQKLGISMNSLAEDMIGRELRVLAEGLEMELTDTIELLRGYRGRSPEQQGADFARAEVEYLDPLRSRHQTAEIDREPSATEVVFGYSLER